MLSGAIEPIDLDISAIIREELSPAARSAALADTARQALAEAEQQDSAALGFVPPHLTTVDGAAGTDENSVRPDGIIVYAFNLLPEIFGWIADMLERFAPVRSGRFKASFELYADGVAIDPDGPIPPGASEFVFVSTAAYAGKIEGESGRPESPQAPNGVFEAVAVLALQQFGGQAEISFSYRPPFDGSPHLTPAITVMARA